MDKRVILAVAGSGKTTNIINQLNLDKRSLVVTYTHNNIRNLRDGILRKFNHFPDNITLLPFFTFLYSSCFRPFLSYGFRTKGINFEINPNRFVKQDDNRYFIDKNRRIYSNRISKLLELRGVFNDVNSRLSKYYDSLFIDEIQDLAGHDFNFLKSISKANIEMTFVGDFYQHTFDTSRDSMVNRSLHVNYNKYKDEFTKMGMDVDCETLKKSYRCNPAICNFITENIGIQILSHKSNEAEIHIIEKPKEATEILKNNNIVKLFYKEYYKYGCRSKNWGDCKGENSYSDVCVVLNKIVFNHFLSNQLNRLRPLTRNKLYVACSRANNDLYLVSEEFFKNGSIQNY